MNDLLKELKLGTLDWKGFLLAGLCPVFVFWFGAVVCLQGRAGLESTLETLLHTPSALAAHSATILTISLMLGAVLYALRPVLLDFHRRVPIPLLRGILLRWSSRRRRKAETQVQMALWRMDVAAWFRCDFVARQFVTAPVLREKRKVDVDHAIVQAQKARRSIAASGMLVWWMKRRGVFVAIQNLHLLAGRRTQIEDYAFKLGQEGGLNSAANWAAAETFFNVKAPGDTLEKELAIWRQLFDASAIIQERIKGFEDYRLFSKYRVAFAKRSYFPNSVWIEPTRLGNIFAALEDYAADRYGMDTALLWSRLESSVPERQYGQIVNYQRTVNMMLNLHASFVALAIFAIVAVKPHHYKGAIFIAAAAVLGSYACLSAAQFSAGALATKMEAAVDLNSLRWLRAMGVTPTDAATRLLALQQLGTFFNGGTALPSDFRFSPVAEPASEGKKKDD